MTAQTQLEQYLDAFRQRLRRLIVARAAAILTVTALLVTIIAVYFGMRRAFDPGFVFGARSVLLASIAAIVIALLVIPLRRMRANRAISSIEARAPEFDGRLETYDGLSHKPVRTPFLGLLAEDALALAKKIPIIGKVPSLHINAPFAVAVLAGLMLLGVGSVGPDNWRYGVRHLWAGWLFDDTLPPQRIAVEPGDGAVRRGGDFTVSAVAEGFNPTSMTLFAQLREGADWQSTIMDRGPERSYQFTFFAVREPVRYYVQAAGLRSQEFTVNVVDLPAITNIRLTYNYPEWTKLPSATQDPGNDIRAVADTEVRVEIETDRPLDNASLKANGESIPMEIRGNVSTATLAVNEEGEYHIATLFETDDVRLTDDYFISVIEDAEPVVRVLKPGRDWRASNIEEVSLNIEATDDFGVNSLELKYSINGGEWQAVAVPADGTEISAAEVMYLEEMVRPQRERRAASRRSAEATPLTLDNLRALREETLAEEAAEDAAQAEVEVAPNGLEPGDLISYYVVAADRDNEVQSDLYFIEVQPFDRRFSQAPPGGGAGGGGGQTPPQNEISARQKEILVATWNLIREQDEDASFLDEQQLADNAAMLSELQVTLAEQARTLASRTRARQLTNADEDIAAFVESLELAAEAMAPAAEELANVALDDAVPAEQEALQHLLRAEAIFSDIQVAFQQGGGGGGGGGLAGRDLSELFELEMDLEKNQYETESPVALEQESSEQEVDDAIAKLQELARRQEELARQAARRNNQLTEQERWQQEQLRRETEELRQELEQLQQQMAQQRAQQGQQSGQQQQGQQGQQGQQQGQPGQQGQTAQNGEQQQGQQDNQGEISDSAMEDINNALQAMNRAAQGQDIDPEQARRAIEQARRELDRALEQMTSERQSAAEGAFSDLAERSDALYEEQRRLATDLQQALENAVDDQINSNGRRGGLPREQAAELSDRKGELFRELEALEADIQRVAQEFRNRTPEATETLNESLADLQQTQAVARLQYGQQALRQGGAQQVAATDAVTTSALRDLQRATESALDRARVEAVEGESRERGPNEQLVAEIQTLRRELAAIAAEGAQANNNQSGGNQPGEQQSNQQPGQQPGEQQGGQQPGQQGGQQPGQQQGGGQAGGQGGNANQLGGNRFGGVGGRGYYDPNRIGAWEQLNADNLRDPETVERLNEQLSDAGRELLTATTRLRGEGVSEAELQAVRELGERLRGSLSGNPELVAQEFQRLVNLAEQLELRLREGSDASNAGIRTEAPSQYEPAYKEEVAEYYRRLSRGSGE